jgi:predicted ATPase
MRLRRVRLENILSFRDAVVSEIGPVTFLIGPNASGKSNFLDALNLLRAAPQKSLGNPISYGGGIGEWLWRGEKSQFKTARIECDLDVEGSKSTLQYLFAVKEQPNGGFVIPEERLVRLGRSRGAAPTPLFDRRDGRIAFGRDSARNPSKNGRDASWLVPTESVLGTFQDPAQRPEIAAVGRALGRVRIYRNFDTSTEPDAKAGARRGVSTSYLPSSELADDGYNLALILSRMRMEGTIKKVEDYLGRFDERFGEVHVDVAGGTARIYIKEQGLRRPTPGARLSDGTLKFLCLLAALFNSESEQSLICIDEPETGLHPDAVRLLARAIGDASPRLQLVIVTHSDVLIDEFSDTPEAVVVCESDSETGTRFKRLSRRKLKTWLQDYSLGELWKKGAIGGNPW